MGAENTLIPTCSHKTEENTLNNNIIKLCIPKLGSLFYITIKPKIIKN